MKNPITARRLAEEKAKWLKKFDPPEEQPREHDVLCSRCLRRTTWNVNGICNKCFCTKCPNAK